MVLANSCRHDEPKIWPHSGKSNDCPMTGMVKGFGCLQAYESLSCRSPRSAFSEPWVFVYWSFRRAADRSDRCQPRRSRLVIAEIRGDWEHVCPAESHCHSD